MPPEFYKKRIIAERVRPAKILLFTLGLFTTIYCQGQNDNYFMVSGKITDKNTDEPLSFAAIGINGTSIGVASNELGEFIINIPRSKLLDTLIVSMLGYHRYKCPINELSGEDNIQLEERVYKLNEVLITAKNKDLSGDEILKRARKSRKSNLPQTDYSLSTFFRETYQLNGEYFRLLEAASIIYGKAFPRTKKDVFINEIRIAPGKDPIVPLSIGHKYNPFRELQGITGTVPNKKACRSCNYEIEKYIFNEDNPAVIITSKYVSKDSSYQSRFTYTIDLTDYAVLQFDFETVMPFGIGFPETLDSTYNSSLIYLKRRLDYTEYKGRYYLNQYHQHLKHAYRAINSNETYSSVHQFQLVTNKIDINVTYEGQQDEKMNYRHQLESNLKEYNESFWKNYNVLKQTPLDQKIISDLEKNRALELQFKSNE
ncbi:MAG: carboxypeptidase-like regulatory domain-containing protein [Bacteroidota bacterium]